jgi:hypothetical protein
MTFACCRNYDTSVAISGTIAPALRTAGSHMIRVVKHGIASMPSRPDPAFPGIGLTSAQHFRTTFEAILRGIRNRVNKARRNVSRYGIRAGSARAGFTSIESGQPPFEVPVYSSQAIDIPKYGTYEGPMLTANFCPPTFIAVLHEALYSQQNHCSSPTTCQRVS